MAELVSDGPGTETLSVKHGRDRLPIGVRHHPLKRRSVPYPTVVTLDIVRVTMPANRICEHGTLDCVFGRLINRPWPFTRISVLSMLIKCRSRSTFGQVR